MFRNEEKNVRMSVAKKMRKGNTLELIRFNLHIFLRLLHGFNITVVTKFCSLVLILLYDMVDNIRSDVDWPSSLLTAALVIVSGISPMSWHLCQSTVLGFDPTTSYYDTQIFFHPATIHSP